MLHWKLDGKCSSHFHSFTKEVQKSLWFCRRDIYAGMVCTLADIRFEMVSILYNIGALHSQLGASDSRVTADGMKLSCTHFQCAAWAFQVFFLLLFMHIS